MPNEIFLTESFRTKKNDKVYKAKKKSVFRKKKAK